MKKENVHDKHRERLRDRYLNEGIDGLRDHEVLELILFYAIPRKDTNELAHKLLNKFGNLSGVFEAPAKELITIDGIGKGTAVYLNMFSQVKRKYESDRIFKKSYINSTNEAGEYCLNLFYARIYESFFVICLNSQNKVISCEKVSEGASDEIVVYPRHIARMAIRNNAVKVIIAHNHPGGTTIPSTEDISITREIKDSLNVVGVELFDHIIVSDNEYNSFAKLNLL
ncbi:MAG: DNA repair protein RadC [Clostridia bacterium]|nr:DNA repair protein RadC [Clostridia bacterium]